MNRFTSFVSVLAIAIVISSSGRAQEQQHHDRGVSQPAIVHFGQPQPPPGTLPAATHFLAPDDVTIRKGGTVIFVVNGGGHGIAIHRVDKKTTREDIAEDLCQGGIDSNDRVGRQPVCNGMINTGVGIPVIIGTQNLNYDITDADDELVIRTGFNNPGAGQANPRVDDTRHSERLLSTSGRVVGDTTAPSANPAGAFLVGSTGQVPPPALSNAPGNRIQVQFLKNGRYLVICQNRGHSLNDHMFGFVTVGGDDDDDDQQ